MGQQLEEKFLALCLEERTGLIKFPPVVGNQEEFMLALENPKYQ